MTSKDDAPLNQIPCPSCGMQVHDQAVACPNCGQQIFVEHPGGFSRTRHSQVQYPDEPEPVRRKSPQPKPPTQDREQSG